jgi:predicted phosphoribosyltransferase
LFGVAIGVLPLALTLRIVFRTMLCAVVHRALFPRPACWGNRTQVIFADRSDAGRQLASKLPAYAGGDTRVLALPRGGVPVGFEVARALNAPLDVFVVRKIGAPGREELAIGAIASGGVRVLHEETIAALGVDRIVVDAITQRELIELRRREDAYRGALPAPDVQHRTVVLVDDGLATGASMHAAILALRQRHPRRIIVAVPVAPADTFAMLEPHVDDLVVLAMPQPFRGVGAWYVDFSQISDDEVRRVLRDASHPVGPA